MSNLALVDGRYRLDLKASHTVYKNAEGKRVPGVTTILGTLAKEALIEWAAKVEREGMINFAARCFAAFAGDGRISLQRWFEVAQVEPLTAALKHGIDGEPYRYTVERDTAADLGTIIHARIHAMLHRAELDPEGIDPAQYAQSVHGAERFMAWWQENGFELVAAELPMVSEHDQVGGTADVIGKDRVGRFHLIDIKSSKPHPKWPWPEVFAQVSQYAEMYQNLTTQFVADVHAVRVGKVENDDVQVYDLTLDERIYGLRIFRGALAVYNGKKELERARAAR